jgi:hypothetical protein
MERGQAQVFGTSALVWAENVDDEVGGQNPKLPNSKLALHRSPRVWLERQNPKPQSLNLEPGDVKSHLKDGQDPTLNPKP